MFDRDSNYSTDELSSRYVRKTPKAFNYVIKLPDLVKDEYTWRDIVHFLREMTDQDSVEIECSGYGGSVQIGSNFLNALSRCKADVKVRVTGDCWSMHALIAAYHPNTEMDSLGHLMFHNMSHSSWGEKLNETIDKVEFYKEWMPEFIKIAAGEILTAAEIKRICTGGDVYLKPADFKSRRKEANGKSRKSK